MSRFKLLYFVIFIINLCTITAQISDKRLCVDEECKVPISLARTLLRYSSPDSRILSFAPNVDITIYSKSAGSREDLWGVEINGKRGYIPKHLVRETKVLNKPTLLIDTEFSNDTGAQQVPSQVEPAKVQEPYEVVDGTTIYLNAQENITPTSTVSPIQTTALPATETKSGESKVVSQQTPPHSGVVEDNTKHENQSSPMVDEQTNPPANQETLLENKVGIDTNKVEKTGTEDVKISTQNKEPPKEGSEITSNAEETDADTKSEDEDDVEVEDEGDEDEEDEDNDEEEEAEDDENEESEELDTATEQTSDESEKNKNEVSNVQTEATVPEVNAESEPQSNITEGEDATGDKSEVNAEILKDSLKKPDQSETNNSDTFSEIVTKVDKSETNFNSSNQNEKQEDVNAHIASDTTELPLSSSEETSKVEAEKSKESTPNTTQLDHENNTEFKPEEVNQESQVPEIETTTLIPELEVPQPFLDTFKEEVTPNPIETVTEEVIVSEKPVSSLPPLGLFGNQNLNHPTTETSVNTDDNIQIIQEHHKKSDYSVEIDENKDEVSQPESKEDTSSKESVEESNEFTFKEEVKVLSKEEENAREEIEEKENSGFFSGIFSLFSSSDTQTSGEEIKEDKELTPTHVENLEEKRAEGDELLSITGQEPSCDATSCGEEAKIENESPAASINMDLFNFNSDIFLYLVTTAVSVVIFLFGYIALDKSKREGPLIAKINNLEKQLLILVKENQILQERVAGDSGYDTNDRVSHEVVENLTRDLYEMTGKRNALEEQVQLLEKELENSTEVGMELNRMLSEILSSENGSDVLKANVEHLQKQLVEQQMTINSVNETLAVTNTENHELRLELELTNKKVVDLQAELDKLLLNVLKIEEEKEAQQSSLENEIATYRQKYEEISVKFRLKEEEYSVELKQLKNRLDQTERNLQLKLREHEILADTIKQLKAMKSNDGPSLQAILDDISLKAEVQQLKTENQKFIERLQQEEEAKSNFEKTAQAAVEEARILRDKYDHADKLRLETETKLEVLSTYFKDREAQLQKEISRHESLWEEKQGEASSTTERIKFMQEQLQNYKAQTESLKQEIMSQEVELKSQISVLEKKAHENWVSARQAERKLEEAKQEAAQLRHRLTLRERAIQEDKSQHRFQSPIEQNGDMPVSSPIESPASPPLLYGTRDHITKSPAMPGLPPFLPPPPGVPFMPPPLPGVPPFIPPPPTMFPGDHRPPPLGRMSSPPLNSRYSPSSRGYSPYDRNSSSPSDSEYGTSPPQRRGYSPFNSRGDDRRDYKRPPQGRSNGRNMMKGGGSSGSGHSNESLDKVNRQQSKV